jgi:hypothetical protein
MGGACEGLYGRGDSPRQPDILPAPAAEEQLQLGSGPRFCAQTLLTCMITIERRFRCRMTSALRLMTAATRMPACDNNVSRA